MSDSLSDRFRRLEPLLDRALDLDGAERDNFLRICAEIHPDLYPDLLKGLGAEDRDLPKLGGLAARVTEERTTDRRGLQAGPWQLLEKIGRGGMGTVYLAKRADGAFDKRAAVKLLRNADLRFKQALERERQLLARLEHPAIARLIDGGVLPDGQPYLVMELAEGLDLDKWAAQEKPDLDTRLRVFLDICGAVSEAHAQLIVHRDLKPSNVRVNREGQVKLLDFGIAKLLDSDVKQGETRALALTPEYAAPEQLRGEPVSTRTDVYALGALLYQLLTGRTPHPGFDGDWASFISRVCDEDADPPSRHETREVPRARLRGDLDAIVQMALQRDPARRYASVEALADDLRRHLDGRPVRAHAPSLGYRLSKWLRRHRLSAGLGAAAALALGAGLAGVLWQARTTAAERDAAQVQAQRYQAVLEHLGLMFREAAAGSGDVSRLSARDLLVNSTAQLERAFATDPAAGQLVLATVGELYVYLQDYSAAGTLLDRFVEVDDGSAPSSLRAQVLGDLALVDVRRGEAGRACTRAEQAIRLLEAEPSDQRGVIANVLGNYGQCLRLLGRVPESLAAYERAAALRYALSGADSPLTASADNNLGTAYYQAGRLAEARQRLNLALAGFERNDLGRSAQAGNVLNNLAAIAFSEGQLGEAQALFERALEVQRAVLGDSAALGALTNNFGKLLTLRGDLQRAQRLLAESLDLQTRFVGADSPDAGFTHLSLGDLQLAQQQAGAAVSSFQLALALFEGRFGPDHLFAARARLALAHAQARAGDPRGAGESYLRALDALAALPGATPARLRAGGHCLRLQDALGKRLARIEATDLSGCEGLIQTLAADHYERLEAEVLLALARGDTDSPRPRLVALAAALGPNSPRLAQLRRLVP
ncbi:serine/threonine-protein kinase [Aquimonas voraii]|uniref:Non-specific serine/threonine protein kinase n=1 Tax=Aquimonas voraii TaxID=265719 RepID=A0A1G6WXK6_9GAMM|nr:serine/threonine-protein kinase [Aquimonas voraii]SDD69786.1 non-specific serine/threonine protein kinase [Aquimonas voraii]